MPQYCRYAAICYGLVRYLQMSDDARKQLDGYRLTTAEILYHMPDHPSILQSFVWQRLDLAPHYPRLQKFLDFWAHNLDGKLHSVKA